MPDTVVAPAPRSTRSLPPVAVPLLVGAAVAIALGVYGRVHDPTGRTLYTLFFTDTIRLKAWLGTGCLVLASGQIFSALWLYGRLGRSGRPAPVWLGDVHRLTGTLTFALSLPVAYHCLWALGYQTSTVRVAIRVRPLRRVRGQGARRSAALPAGVGPTRSRRAGLHPRGPRVVDQRPVVLPERDVGAMSKAEPQRRLLSRLVGVVQYVVGVATATTVVLLFSLGGRDGTVGSTYATSSSQQIDLGRSVYAAECAICHGGQGEGGTGPSLVSELVVKYPEPETQEAIVANGRNSMLGFGTRLTPAEITAVVLYTRTELAASPPS